MPHLRPLHSASYVGQTVDAIRKADKNKGFEQGSRIGDGGKGILAREKRKVRQKFGLSALLWGYHCSSTGFSRQPDSPPSTAGRRESHTVKSGNSLGANAPTKEAGMN
jgi:hypothetical protein